MNGRMTIKAGASLCASLLFGSMVLEAEEVPWKFEGDTNRVAAAECASAVPCANFCACEVGQAVSASAWDDLVRSIWTSSLSEPASIPVRVGALLFIR